LFFNYWSPPPLPLNIEGVGKKKRFLGIFLIDFICLKTYLQVKNKPKHYKDHICCSLTARRNIPLNKKFCISKIE
jgi:hypothetical protein